MTSATNGETRPVSRRAFYCGLAQREVEVEFLMAGLPGLRFPIAVVRCSVFDPPTDVTCSRRCVDASFRRQWEPALPVPQG